MLMHTRSGTPLERVMVEPSQGGKAHVWLRRNIVESVENFEGQSVEVWDADEVYYLSDEQPTVAEMEARFAELWAGHELDGVPEADQLRARVDELTQALGELGSLLGGE